MIILIFNSLGAVSAKFTILSELFTVNNSITEVLPPPLPEPPLPLTANSVIFPFEILYIEPPFKS